MEFSEAPFHSRVLVVLGTQYSDRCSHQRTRYRDTTSPFAEPPTLSSAIRQLETPVTLINKTGVCKVSAKVSLLPPPVGTSVAVTENRASLDIRTAGRLVACAEVQTQGAIESQLLLSSCAVMSTLQSHVAMEDLAGVVRSQRVAVVVVWCFCRLSR